MWRRLGFLIRSDERKAVAIAFAFLCGLVASHTALESARDGLFLANIPGDRLPFVYVGIAVISYLATKAKDAVKVSSRRGELTGWTLFAGAGTLALGAGVDAFGVVGLYVLYIWSGVVTALVLVHFWAIMADIFTATQAKRVFGVVGLGGMMGAVAGSALVSLFARVLGPRAIVFAAGIGFIATASLPRFLPSRSTSGRGPKARHILDPLLARFRANVQYATRGPYVWRLIGVALAGSVAVTLTDFVFKSTMAASVPANDLTTAFARTYLVLNVLSLIVQIVAVGWVLRRFAPAVVVAILPVLLCLSGSLLAVTGGLLAAILAKGADGALRYGLYKTGLELLCVPLNQEARRKVKVALELAGQRGGQVVASTMILVVAVMTEGTRVTAVLLTVIAALWALLALKLHGYYVEQFRESIVGDRRNGASRELDVASLETLITTLDSDATDEVIAALSLLQKERKDHLVPGLILFHPKEEVVVAALRIFARKRRKVSKYALDHLTAHPSPRIRAEAYAARAALAPDPEELRLALEREQAPEARAAIVSAMAAASLIDPDDARRMVAEQILATDAQGRVVIADTIGWGRVEVLVELLAGLAEDREQEVREAAIAALGSIGSPRAAEALVEVLADETVQKLARAALAQAGASAFEALVKALHDASRAAPVRWAVPKALATVDPTRAAPILLENLEREPDGMVRYRTIVALGGIIDRAPRVLLDRARIRNEMKENVARAYRYLDRRLVLEAGALQLPARKTRGHELLTDLLRDKQRSTVGRVFRLLGLASPQHDFGAIYRAIENGERPHRAGAVELTAQLLPSPLREAVVGLVEEIDDEARMAYARPFHEPIARSYDALLSRLLSSRSAIVRDVTAFHVSELRDATFLPALSKLDANGLGSADVQHAIDVLRGARPQSAEFAAVSLSPEVSRAG